MVFLLFTVKYERKSFSIVFDMIALFGYRLIILLLKCVMNLKRVCWISYVACHRASRGFAAIVVWCLHAYFVGPKLFLVGILWDQNIFLLVFQIDFNNCKLCLYWIGTSSAKLLMLLRRFSFCYILGQNISDKL